MNLLDYQQFYLVGIKGVAMTSLAQCLVDAGKSVRGSDVAEEFVTQRILNGLQIKIDTGFEAELPPETDCVIFTSAHSAQQNPQVLAARAKHISTFSQAEALAAFFNQQKGIAVCGVGGKSTVSAMIAWIFEKAGLKPSFSVGVGNIPGLEKTGQWNPNATYFISEADEYVTDPSAPSRGEKITPRFSFLKPWMTVCTNLEFDHPDVYKDFDQTKAVYREFFESISEGGSLIVNAENEELLSLAKNVVAEKKTSLFTFGGAEGVTAQLVQYAASEGKTISDVLIDGKEYTIELSIPGKFNVMNALAALLAAHQARIDLDQAIHFLKDFHSTMRRSEFIGVKNGVLYYDDYAHHPNEVRSIIAAFKEWFPKSRLVVGFQSHTFSRTKSLFAEFVNAFSAADEVVMIDIFASAREKSDPSISSDVLCAAIQEKFPHISATNVHTIENLATFCRTTLHAGDVFLTVGAGDIYKVHELL